MNREKKYWGGKNFSCAGQTIAVDFLFALLLFLLVLNSALSIWKNNSLLLEKQGTISGLQLEAIQAIDLLVRSSGSPDNWEERSLAETQIIGLAKRDRVLDPAKVNRFVLLSSAFGSDDYNGVKARLLVGRDFYFRLSNGSGTIAGTETAKPGDLDSQWAVNVKRIVEFGGDSAVAELTLYYPNQ
ncbi:MAG: hypothetical protein NTW59_00020 [Candidatus Diapherotrites archaeon]|nr:hypothetical protein [Candidatus Diapherotrites archaeon]